MLYVIHSNPSKNQITNAFNWYSFINLLDKHISIWNESVEMRGLEQTKAIETGIIFLSKIDKIIPDYIALKRCKQMVQKSEKTRCDVVCQIYKSCANQETSRRWQVVPSGVIFWKLTYYVVDVGSKNSTRLGCKKRTKNWMEVYLHMACQN